MISADRFATGMTFDAFKDSMRQYRDRLEKVYADVVVSPTDAAFFRQLVPLDLRVLAIVEDWCPDVIQHLPVLMRLAEHGGFTVRLFRRDENDDLMAHYLCPEGKKRIPVFAFFDCNLNEVGRWVERTRMAERLVQEGRRQLPAASDPLFAKAQAEFYQRMGQIYKQGRLHQECMREIRELLTPLAPARA